MTKYPIVYLNDENCFLPLEKLTAIAEKKLTAVSAEKVNLMAWSRWGLAARVLANKYPQRIASVTTVCTPHRGLRTVSRRFGKAAVTCWGKLFGADADFAAAVLDMTEGKLREFNLRYPDVEGIFYQSCACAIRGKVADKRLNSAHSTISIYDGENDGVVSVYSAMWGQRGKVYRGVSHLGVSSEIYAQLISELENQGL